MAGFGFRPSRTACKFGLGLILTVLGGYGLQYANAIGDTRTLTLHHVHTNEDITVTFKRNGRFDDAAMQKLNWFLRDWRRNEQVTVDPNLIDLLWEVHREVGAKAPVHVVCGYRAPETNSMLRARSNGVALFSQHMSGNAMDFFIPGISIEEVRVTALRLQSGGVGYYPGATGSRFVHLDTGNVRHWPRMTRDELVKVFPNERTIHIPADGHPLSGYALALADIERGANHRPGLQPKFNAFAKLDRGHEEEDASTGSIRQPQAAMRQASLQANLAVPAASTQAANTQAANKTPPLPPSRPAVFEVGKVFSPPGSKTVTVPHPVATASIFSPWPTSQKVDRVSPDVALAYAATARYEPTPKTPLQNVQRAAPQIPPETKQPPAAATLQSTAKVSPEVISPRLDNAWLRAVVLAPSMYRFMTATQLNPLDSRQLGALMQKPSSAVMMTFSASPYGDMNANAFSGKAVQFLATVNFGMRTAALR